LTKTKSVKVHNFPFQTMEIGDSFKIEDKKDVQYVRNRATHYGRKLGRVFTVNSVEMTVRRYE